MRTDKEEFDLHGLVGIRVLNATPGDIAAVKKQLGPIQKPLSRPPDIVIRFVEQLVFSSPVRYLGIDDAGYTADAFFVFRGKHQSRVRVQIPFQQIGGHECEIVCESGLAAVPLLIPIINLTMLSKGILPMHASALRYNGRGILVTGWAKGGKTETLLAFIARGAEYIGDEWIYIGNEDQQMYGIPEPIRLWYWHLQEMPHYKALVSRGNIFRLQALNLFVAFLERLELSVFKKISAPGLLVRRLTALLKRQLYVQLPPEKLFGRAAGGETVYPEKVFFVVSHDRSDLIVESVSPQEIAQRMVFSLQEERIEFMSYYLKYRFAFPECPNPVIEQAEETQRRILSRVLESKETYAVYHPYPFSIPALFDAIHPYCA